MNDKKLTTTGASLTFGDLGPLWVYRKPETPGNNYMVFDEYKITVETSDEPVKTPPTLAWTGWTDDGRAMLQMGGDDATDYTVEVSDDLKTWTPLETAKPGDTWKEITDPEAPRLRAALLPRTHRRLTWPGAALEYGHSRPRVQCGLG